MIAIVGSPAFGSDAANAVTSAVRTDAPGAPSSPGGASPGSAAAGLGGASPGSAAAGLAASVAMTAAAVGAEVQLVGKVGDDAAGEAVILALARARVGHAALSRTAVATPVMAATAGRAGPDDDDQPLLALLAADLDAGTDERTHAGPDGDWSLPGAVGPWGAGQALDAGDVAVGLDYLSGASVVVVAADLDAAAAQAVADAASFAGGQIVAIVAVGRPVPPPLVAAGAVVLEAPSDDPEGAFAGLVGRFAAALDRGTPAADAFRLAVEQGGWQAAED
jgi:hypothetical protein